MTTELMRKMKMTTTERIMRFWAWRKWAWSSDEGDDNDDDVMRMAMRMNKRMIYTDLFVVFLWWRSRLHGNSKEEEEERNERRGGGGGRWNSHLCIVGNKNLTKIRQKTRFSKWNIATAADCPVCWLAGRCSFIVFCWRKIMWCERKLGSSY